MFETLGYRIQSLRNDRGMSQADVVARLSAMGVEISQGYLSRIEKNARIPAADVIAGLCRIFSVSADYLLLQQDEINSRKGFYSDEATRVASMMDAMSTTDRAFVAGLVRYVASAKQEEDQQRRMDAGDVVGDAEKLLESA